MYKKKKLYKIFKVEGGKLVGPYTGAKYYDGDKARWLTPTNASGWVSYSVPEPSFCLRGWHAYSLDELRDRWDYWANTRKFEVELYNCFTDGRKWVGEKMKILRPYSREKFREWKRKHAKKPARRY